jgi:two-component system CheB/CheR fusion protein
MSVKDTQNGSSAGKGFPIVCIGASAGGLEALQRFLSVLPPHFGFALVFIQHLSSKYKSILPELISAKRPSLVIQEISEGLKALPGRLYLAPPGKEVRIRDEFFRLTVHPEGLVHLPIDEFLSSLAEDASERAIAVIFSGAGTDGARGCRTVRVAGGTVFVQDPETAEFGSMPLAAIATGQADAVLSPEDICRELLNIQDIGTAAVSREPVITPEEYDSLFRVLLDKTGGRFNHYKKSVVGRRIRRRMYLHGVSSVKDYIELVSSRDSEAASLASDLMIGVTSFFRDRLAWKALNLEVVRKLATEDTDLPVRVWAPASATGEEAYSITMMLSYELAQAGKTREIQVFATDVNDRALEKAREGRYPASISADVPREYIQKYFTSVEDGQALVVNKETRERVVVAKQDLLTDPPFSKLDLIICRNFMIYLEPEAQEKCISLFHYALKNGGFLFLGNAETVGRRSALFKTIGHKQCRVYRKVETTSAPRLPLSVPYAAERSAQPPAPRAAVSERQSSAGFAQEFLLEEYAPAAIAIDQNYEIVYHNGPTNRYLRQPRGVPTRNLLDLLPDALRNRIRGAVYRAGQEGKPVSIRANVSGDDNRKRPVTLRIARIKENLFVVVFQEKGGLSKAEAAVPLDARRIEETAIHQLENELSATRQDLQSHIEQLKSLNEELQSSNEELQAANEELETSREELQSLNEELVTVNSQLQVKIEEQDETNNDLNNFLASTNIPTIFLDQLFRVKRYTPAMLRLIKLLPSDVGRPIVDMSQENLGPDLIADAESVLESLVPVKQEIRINSTWFVRTTLPYRTGDSRIAGVVVTYNDVTELKTAEERTRHLASFPQFNPNPVLEANPAGAIVYSNAATQNVLEGLGLNRDDAAVFLPHDIDGILTDLEKNREETLTREVTAGDRTFEETIYVAPKFSAVRIYAFDITERKRAEELTGRLAALVESADDAIISKDLNGVIQTWNIGAEKIFGYTAAEAVGRNISFLVTPDHVDETPEIIKRIFQGEHIDHFESVRLHKNGTVVPVSLTYSAIKDARGKVIGVSKIAHDITERKRADKEIRRRIEELRRANEELERFNKAAVGRELRMIELKKEVNELSVKTGESPRYPLEFEEKR